MLEEIENSIIREKKSNEPENKSIVDTIRSIIQSGKFEQRLFKYNFMFQEKEFQEPTDLLLEKAYLAFQSANNVIVKLNGNKLTRRKDYLFAVGDSVHKLPLSKLLPIRTRTYEECFEDIEKDLTHVATSEEERETLELKEKCLKEQNEVLENAIILRIVRKEPNGAINKEVMETFLYELEHIIIEIGSNQGTDLNIQFSGKELKQILEGNK